MSEHNSDMMTVPEAASYLRISRDHAYELIARDELPHVHLGRVIRVPRFGLERWIARTSGLPRPPEVTVMSQQRHGH